VSKIQDLQDTLIPKLDPPVIQNMQVPVNRGLALPVFQNPDPSLQYPTVRVPTQAEFDAAVKADRDNQAQELEKNRGLPDTRPPEIPQQLVTAQTPPAVTRAEIPAETLTPSFTVAGLKIDLPDPSLVATAGAVAVVTTAATMVSSIGLNALKNAAEPIIREATKNKFKIKIKQVKPVLHYVMSDSGNVDIFEYSAEGTKLVGTTDNVENYIRAQVETNAFYETENKIIIDDVIASKFTKEGQTRFKSLFAPAKKVAKKLSAKLSF
jgi:hypothetical protein